MFRKLLSRIFVTIGVIFFFNPDAIAQIRLPRLISDGMVLQRDLPVKIWGWAGTGEKVTVKLKDKVYATKAGANHRWEIELPATPAGGPYQMVIGGSNQIILNDILFGDVWVCSGQSNMEFVMGRAKEKYAAVIAGSTNTAIRQFFVKPRFSFQPKDDVESPGWLPADPKNVLQFTAVGYFFALALHEKYHVPIGLINTSVGGTPAEAWTSSDGLMKLPGYLEKIEPYRDSARVASILTSNASLERNWNQHILQNDSGFINKAQPWTNGLDNIGHWDTLIIPGALPEQTLSNFSGVIWLKRTVTLPPGVQPHDAVLLLGSFSDRDTTYVNGHRVGFTPNRYQPRKYQVPARWLHSGDNTIVVRTVVTKPPGTFTEGKPYEWKYGDTTLSLTGKWLYRIGFAATPFPASRIVNFNNQPTALYNAMIAPLTPFNIKGVIWYQGEANTTRAADYNPLFKTMITDWRNQWRQGKFPFLFVQLANLGAAPHEPGESNWAALREAQAKALVLPNTGMTVAHDLGEWNDIHPLNKQDVGYRFALNARVIAYKEKGLVFAGPTYKSMHLAGNRCIIKFYTQGSSLVVKNGSTLKGFQVAGADHKFYWANANIDGDKIIVWSDAVKKPVAIRYAWANNPEGANLYNSEGLPASCFRTDNW